MSEFDQDLDYLRAELAQAQQMGINSTLVRVTELQGLLDRLRALSEIPVQPVQVMGFCRPGEVRGFRKGSFSTIRVKRKTTEWHTEPVYFDPPNLYGKRAEE